MCFSIRTGAINTNAATAKCVCARSGGTNRCRTACGGGRSIAQNRRAHPGSSPGHTRVIAVRASHKVGNLR